VTQIAPNEPDAYYFIGYLNTQLQKYDAAIAAYQKAIEIFRITRPRNLELRGPISAEAMAIRRRSICRDFRELRRIILGVPFGAGYGDQGNFRWRSTRRTQYWRLRRGFR
jgi:tetratricopeptide (TPR) repeat protein